MKTLLLGNGLNMLDGAPSWRKLMDDLCQEDNVHLDSNIPSPLQFEMLNARRGWDPVYRYKDNIRLLKESIAKRVAKSYRIDSFVYEAVRSGGYSNILTTNYDMSLENCFGFSQFKKNRNLYKYGKIYMFDPTAELADRCKLFHIHGLAEYPNTICIGYEHYAGYIQQMRSKLVNPSNEEDARPATVDIIKSSKSTRDYWPDLFFVSDIDIVGLGLSFDEIDLWWLLSLRAALYAGQEDIKDKMNSICYYLPKPKQESADDSTTSLKSALKGVDVSFKCVEGKSYKECYRKIFNMLANKRS